MTFTSEYEPFFQPPGWIVGPVWAVLYTTIAISFSSILSRQDELQHFTSSLAHRGPDGTGIYIDNSKKTQQQYLLI